MKFVYVDETGDKNQSDVFVMTGLLIDAYRLRKYTATFDAMITEFLAKHPNSRTELKTKAIINGSGGWSKVDAGERKKFLGEVCDLAIECATVYAIAFSFQNFEKAMAGATGRIPRIGRLMTPKNMRSGVRIGVLGYYSMLGTEFGNERTSCCKHIGTQASSPAELGKDEVYKLLKPYENNWLENFIIHPYGWDRIVAGVIIIIGILYLRD